MKSNATNTTDDDKRTRTFFRLPRMAFARPLTFGAARFVDSDTLIRELDVALRREPTTDSMRSAHEAVREVLSEWGDDAALEVSTFPWLCTRHQDE